MSVISVNLLCFFSYCRNGILRNQGSIAVAFRDIVYVGRLTKAGLIVFKSFRSVVFDIDVIAQQIGRGIGRAGYWNGNNRFRNMKIPVFEFQ